MSQALYAWYAFDTSGDQKVSTDTLIGGTGIGEGDTGVMASYDRNIPGTGYFGDFIWFNTDGSLAASGGAGGYPGPAGLNFNYMTTPRVYLPPMNWDPPVSPIPSIGAEITPVDLNFGTYGLLGIGKRDGIYCDAEGNYQIVNGVNTYVPKSTAYAASQNGYPDGILKEINFNLQGVIQGTFSNGRIIDLAQVVLSQVNNPEGLAKVGSQYYTLSANSGSKRVGAAGSGGLGIIQGYSLEASNVDLTVELTNMILAQRAFEANARMVSVVSSTLDVVNRLGQ
jgi:flagellar hook protein FlgE